MSVAFVLRMVWVPYAATSSPIEVTHLLTMRAYWRVDKCGDRATLLGKRNALFESLAWSIHASRDCLVISVTSNCTGRCVLRCMTIARCMMLRPCAMSLTFKLSRSQPRNLLSIARLNSARSLACSINCRRIQMAHISFNFKRLSGQPVSPYSRRLENPTCACVVS